jgi:hypothetical protein
VDYFWVRSRGCTLLTLGNPPKILRDDSREDSSTNEPSNNFDWRACSRMIQEDGEPPLEKQHHSKNEFINITII